MFRHLLPNQDSPMSQADTSTMANALHAIDLAPTERYHLLAADRRRLAIEILAQEQSAIERNALAEKIAQRETDEEPDSDAISDVELSLHHVHLPKLAAAGVIGEYSETQPIELTEPLDVN